MLSGSVICRSIGPMEEPPVLVTVTLASMVSPGRTGSGFTSIARFSGGTVDVGLWLGVGVGVARAVDVVVGVWLGVGESTGVDDGVSVFASVAVWDGVSVAVAVGVSVAVWVMVGVCDGVEDTADVAVAVGVKRRLS